MLQLSLRDLFEHSHPVTSWGSLPVYTTSLKLLPSDSLWVFEGSYSVNQKLRIPYMLSWLPTLCSKSYVCSFAISLKLFPSFLPLLPACLWKLPLPRHDQMAEILGNATSDSFLWLSFRGHGNKAMDIITADHPGTGFNMTSIFNFACNCKKDQD